MKTTLDFIEKPGYYFFVDTNGRPYIEHSKYQVDLKRSIEPIDLELLWNLHDLITSAKLKASAAALDELEKRINTKLAKSQ